MAKKPPRGQKNYCSNTLRSFENLFKILPIGVISKYKLIGAFKTLFKINLCTCLAAYHAEIMRMKLLKNVKIEFTVAYRKVSPE